MAGNTRTLTIRWLSDTSQVEKGARRASGALGKIGTIAAGAFTGSALESGAEKLVSFLGDSAKAASEDEAGQRILAQTLRNVAGARDDQIRGVEKYITRAQDATGVTDDQLRPAFATLARATHDITKAQALTNTAMDVSAGTGRDLSSVTLALAKAYNGNLGGLQRMGVKIDAAKAKAQGFGYVQAQLNKTFGGDAATAADTSEGKMKRLSARWHEMQENIGMKLLPVLTMLADFLLNKLPAAIDVAIKWVQTNWPKIEESMRPLIVFVQRTVTNVEQYIRGLVLFLQGFIQFIRAVFSGQWGQAWEGIKKMFAGFALAFTAMLKQMWNQIQNITFTALKLMAQATVAAIRGILNSIANMITGAVRVLANFGSMVWGAISGAASWLVNNALSLGARIGGAIVGGITAAVRGLGNTLSGLVRGALNFVLRAWNAIDIGLHVHIPSWVPVVGGKGFDINDLIPDVPLLAAGGLSMGTGLAVLHPNELVTPLNKVGGVGNTYNITQHIAPGVDPVAVGKATVDAIRAYERRNGTSWRSTS